MNIAEQISKMDVKSEEFFELYNLVDEKYWTIENPTRDQKCRQILKMLADRGDDWQVDMLVLLANEMLRIEKEGGETGGSFTVGDDEKEIWFTFSDKPGPLGKLQTALRNTVIVKAREQSESDQAEGDKGE